MNRLIVIFLVTVVNSACYGQWEKNSRVLDSTALLTITPSDTLRGHYSLHKTEIDTFNLIKRYYFHDTVEFELIGFDYPNKVRHKTYDKPIIFGSLTNGKKSGKWTYASHLSEEFDSAKEGVWMHCPGYNAYYYPDSIVVHGFWGTEVIYDLVSGQKKGYLINGYTEPKHFVCDAESCEFINDDSPAGEWIWYELDGALWDIERLHKITEVEFSE